MYQVYFNGRKIGTFGKLDGRPVIYAYRPLVFPIPDALLRDGAPATLAIRFWEGHFLESPDQKDSAGGLRGIPVLGPTALLGIFRQNLRQQQSDSQLAYRWNAGLCGAVGLISLFLFSFSRNRREYLWAGMVLFSLAALFSAGTAP